VTAPLRALFQPIGKLGSREAQHPRSGGDVAVAALHCLPIQLAVEDAQGERPGGEITERLRHDCIVLNCLRGRVGRRGKTTNEIGVNRDASASTDQSRSHERIEFDKIAGKFERGELPPRIFGDRTILHAVPSLRAPEHAFRQRGNVCTPRAKRRHVHWRDSEPMQQTMIEAAGSAKLFDGSPGSGRDPDETVVEPARKASLNLRRQQIDIRQDDDRL
jgi:hypothetical protein